MIQLVYTGSGVNPLSKDVLLQLLDKARRYNESLEITGMLLYKDGNFMQALEGDEAQVHSLSARIAKDPWHKDIRILLDSPCAEREFPDWSMGFQNLNDVDLREVPGYSTFVDSPLQSHTFTNSPALCRKLLLLFKTKPVGF
jgi:hypothetical protein